MKRFVAIVVVVIMTFSSAEAQIYAKLNGLYALVGVVNPQVEAVIAPHSTLSVEATFSPWKSFDSHHLFFGMFGGEYRYYINGAAKGFYGAFDAGMMGFDINKPFFLKNGKFLDFNHNYGKGFGLYVGLGLGYHHHFNERWSIDAFVAFAYMRSWYNGYKPNGEVVMDPQGHEDYLYPDPFNGSSEIQPLKVGISIGYALFRGRRN